MKTNNDNKGRKDCTCDFRDRYWDKDSSMCLKCKRVFIYTPPPEKEIKTRLIN